MANGSIENGMYCQMAKRPTDTIIGMVFSLKCNLSGMHGERDMMQAKMKGKKETVIESSHLVSIAHY